MLTMRKKQKMAKGKNKIPKRYLKQLNKRIADYTENVPKWVKELKKERVKNEV